jgi:SpoVK/Ycf46/Vps4 family AAA+-type ATPase
LLGTHVEIAPPTSNEQRTAWQQHLQASAASNIPELLSGQFELSLTSIDRIVKQLNASNVAEISTLRTTLWDACRNACRPMLEDLVQRIDTKATWEDLVVPADQMHLLKQITGQVRHRSKVLDDWGLRSRLNRGFGVTVLFSGESGTGKTMAAEVIANDLRLDLFRIDLSSVVNKYIGETEKNLRKLFDAAESGGAILFFDEADALFGKRSEVKDSHDRYANIETNYLLQRLESFRGLAILASNNKSNMDSAYLRRLRFVVDFTFPEAAQRKEIWRRVFPSETPLSAFDATQLAKIGISGGNIHNIALNAAFAAAATRDSIDMSCLLDSAKSELIKAQKPLSVPGIQWPTIQEARS